MYTKDKRQVGQLVYVSKEVFQNADLLKRNYQEAVRQVFGKDTLGAMKFYYTDTVHKCKFVVIFDLPQKHPELIEEMVEAAGKAAIAQTSVDIFQNNASAYLQQASESYANHLNKYNHA